MGPKTLFFAHQRNPLEINTLKSGKKLGSTKGCYQAILPEPIIRYVVKCAKRLKISYCHFPSRMALHLSRLRKSLTLDDMTLFFLKFSKMRFYL